MVFLARQTFPVVERTVAEARASSTFEGKAA
jgi:hypothetical protein